MAAQIAGALLAVGGILWVGFTFNWSRNEMAQVVVSLMGVAACIGGLLLWGLGRIESAISASPEMSRRSRVVSLLLLFVILLAAASVGVYQFLGSSSKPDQGRPPPDLPRAGARGDK